jgi:hypothetical protein
MKTKITTVTAPIGRLHNYESAIVDEAKGFDAKKRARTYFI